MRYLFIFCFALLGIVTSTYGQKKIRIKYSDEWEGRRAEDGTRYDKFFGNVAFEQNNTTIYCDTAIYIKKTNMLEAIGNVRIDDGDSVSIRANRLTYNGDNKTAKLRNNVIFSKKGKITLYTNNLDYDRKTQMAYYFNKGKLVDSVNTLTSERGYFDSRRNLASFKKDVVATNPDYTLRSDTMQYSTNSRIVFFKDKTSLTDSDGAVFNYEAGSQYNTEVGKSNFKNGILENESYKIEGDHFLSDQIRKQYKITGNVRVYSKKEDVIIEGDEAEYWKREKHAKVYGNAVMKKHVDGDTLYLKADTLLSIDSNTDSKKRMLAYPNVEIFKTDIQGKADSLSYHLKDSTIHLYTQPILWNLNNQISADSMNIVMRNNGIDRLNMKLNCFVVSKDTVGNFNQIKGRKMLANFNNGQISKVFVKGNGETIYYALEEQTNLTMGLNKVECSNMRIDFVNSFLNEVVFFIQPTANFIPIHEIKTSDKSLSGFISREEERPINPFIPKKQVKSTSEDLIEE